ncbi:hypothetical protein AAF712_016862, partial [Marasmius tenuissimus]
MRPDTTVHISGSPDSTGDTPVADEEDYDPPDPDTLGDSESQTNLPEQTRTTPRTDYTPPPTVQSTVKGIRIAEEFISELRKATINGPDAQVEPLPADFVKRLRNPPEEPPAVDDHDKRLSLEVFLAVSNASEKTYTT